MGEWLKWGEEVFDGVGGVFDGVGGCLMGWGVFDGVGGV